MATVWAKLLYAATRIGFLVLGIAIVTVASLELICAPSLTFKYFWPSLLHHGVHQPLLTCFYCFCLLTQVANFLGSLVFFCSVMLTNYAETWFAFDVFGLLSASASLSLVVHRQLTGVDLYAAVVQPDIYFQTAKTGNVRCNRNICYHTEVFVWHQQYQCCGWHSAEELLGLGHTLGRNLSDEVPQFCCSPDARLVRLDDKVLYKGFSPLAEPCRLKAKNRFRDTCDFADGVTFFEFVGLSLVSHPSSLTYSAIKLATALGYTFLRKQIWPQAEGLYASNVPV